MSINQYSSLESSLQKEVISNMSDILKEQIVTYLNIWFDTVNITFTFTLFDSGYTSNVYKFEYNHKTYLLKVIHTEYSHDIVLPTLPPSEYYLDALTSFVVEEHQCRLFYFLDNHINLADFLIHNIKKDQPCYLLDEYRWIIIMNLINLIKNIHDMNVYHRDLHTKNIMINKNTLQLILIDLDSACISDEDCSSDIHIRYNQHPFYTRDIVHRENLKFDSEYSREIDWYAVGMICLEILCFHSIPINVISDLIKSSHNINESIFQLAPYCYPKCSIHFNQFHQWCDLFLLDCFYKNAYKNITRKHKDIYSFYKEHYHRSSYFVIRSEAEVDNFYGFVFKRVFDHIITHAFPTHSILIEKDGQMCYIITNQVITIDLPSNLIIRGTHYWTGPNCFSANDVDKTTFGNQFIPKEKRCVPEYPYQDDRPYRIPYMSLSIEPLRAGLNPYQLPICEINTLVKDKRNIKNVSPYDIRLNKKVMWWGKQLYYFDPYTYNQWIPYLTHYYIDSIEFNTEENISVASDQDKYGDKPIHFIFIATNCTSEIRNDLFLKLEEKDPFKLEDITLKKVRSYGSCLNNSKGKLHPKDKKCSTHSATNANWNSLPCVYTESKFTFAIENTLSPGYISEKIMMAFQGGSIPIYYGPPEIKKYFKTSCFYYVNDKLTDPNNPTEEELNAITEELWKLAEDDSENGWKKYLKEKCIFVDDRVPDILLYKTAPWMEEFIRNFKYKYNEELHRLQTLDKDPIKSINLESEGRKKRKKSKVKGKRSRTRKSIKHSSRKKY